MLSEYKVVLAVKFWKLHRVLQQQRHRLHKKASECATHDGWYLQHFALSTAVMEPLRTMNNVPS